MAWDACDPNAFLVTDATDPIDRVERAKVYRTLVEEAGYRGVEIDILAGASAGGLNAVLYGLSQASRSVLDETVRRTWINEGGIWELLHPGVVRKSDTQSWGDWFRRLPRRRLKSILQGDTRLYKVAHTALCELSTPSDRGEPRQYAVSANRPYNISIELAATLLDDVYSPGRDNRAGFSFRRTAGSLASGFSTIPSATDQDESALARLALAARSTSSFPGAFEPAELRSVSSEFDAAELLINMAPVFPHARQRSEHADEPSTMNPFVVVDGGIFDNIPIDRAIRAIRRAPSALPSERRLIYIDPEPPSAPTPVASVKAKTEEVTAWLPVIRASSALQKRSETAADEIGQLREHNDAVRKTQGRLEALANRLGAAGFVTPVESAAYTQYRIGADTARIGDLLCDPWSYVCQPPRYSSDYHALPAEQAVHIGAEVRVAYNDGLPDQWPLSHDVYAVLDQIRLMIAWVREMERLVPHYNSNVPRALVAVDVSANLASWKTRLYRYMLVAAEAKQQTVDLVLTDKLKGSLPSVSTSAYAVKDPAGVLPRWSTLAGAIRKSQVRQHGLKVPAAVVDELQIEPLPETDSRLYSALAEWIAKIPTDLADECEQKPEMPLCGRDDGGSSRIEHSFCTLMGADLEALRIAIRNGSEELARSMRDIESDFPWVRRWRESVFPHFYLGMAQLDIASLATVFAETGTPDTAALVTYEEITSDLPPALPADKLEPIRRAAKAKHMERWLRHGANQQQVDAIINDPRSVMNADAKLAGNELSRFGGFFLARWRENDWQWGRLDAAAGIVRVLDSSSLPAQDTRVLQESILSGANAGLAAVDHFLPLRVGAETLDSIDPHYRFALASRVTPLVFRSLLPTDYSSLAAVVRWVGLLIARVTVGVLVPLLADPLRLAVAVTVMISAAGLLGGGETHRLWLLLPAGLAIAVAVRTAGAELRWSRLEKLIDGADQNAAAGGGGWREVLNFAIAGIRGSRWCRTYSWFLAGASAAVAIAGWRNVPPLATLLLVVAAIGGLHMWCTGRIYRIRDTGSNEQTLGGALLVGFANIRAGFLADSRSAARTRAVRPAISVSVLLAAVLAAYISHLIAHGEPDEIFGLPDPVALSTGLPSSFVVAVTAGILSLNSLWGWASDRATLSVAGLATGIGFLSQWGLSHLLLAERHAAWDLLPGMVWLIVVGLVVQYLPCRSLDAERSERNTLYGEKDRPVVPSTP